jgi:hypothetical protein
MLTIGSAIELLQPIWDAVGSEPCTKPQPDDEPTLFSLPGGRVVG